MIANPVSCVGMACVVVMYIVMGTTLCTLCRLPNRDDNNQDLQCSVAQVHN